jgi:SAM-dependent methyltransferase
MTGLTPLQAKEFYDRFGRKQDWQRFYEDRAVKALIRHGEFGEAGAVFEFGCGTGRLAGTLLEQQLPPDARYVGVDISETMVGLAAALLERFRPRAEVRLTDGSFRFDFGPGVFDRFVSCYVFDLLSPENSQEALQEADRLLSDGGLLCLVSLTRGFTPLSRLVERLWMAVYRARPTLVGGCRPISLSEVVCGPHWHVLYHQRFSSYGIPSEVLIAEKQG